MFRTSQVLDFKEENKECSYFKDRHCDIHYRYMDFCSTKDQQMMLERGWRRFGNMHFVPECKECNECQTIRINTKDYKYSKSEKRVFKKNKDTQVYIQAPTVTLQHIDLFNAYHEQMELKKGWEKNVIDVQEYQNSYVNGAHEFGKEILYFRGDRLMAVALADILPGGISSVYCYYDHEFEEFSPGKYSILAQISIAKQLNIPYLYLGYWIKDHLSMGYKENYKPFEILQNRPTLQEETQWSYYE